MRICSEPDDFTGNMLIDDTYLRERHGFGDAELAQYRMDPDVEPPRVLALEEQDWGANFRRGDVKKVAEDAAKSD